MRTLFLLISLSSILACESDPMPTDGGRPTDSGTRADTSVPVDSGGGTDAGTGVDTGPTASCSDGILNQDESDTDCGGVCPGCAEGEDCNAPSDLALIHT